MNPLSSLVIDLDAPWGIEDAGEVVDTIPLVVIAGLLDRSHGMMHAVFQDARKKARLRPWRWHRLRRLKRREAAYCAEFSRRIRLVREVVEARAEVS